MGKWSRRKGAPSLDDVAGNGLINRRALLGQGFAVAGAVGAAGMTAAAAEPLKDAPWSLEFGQNTQPLQSPSPFEKNVVRALSNPNGEIRNSHARTPHHLIGGTVTPNSLHFSINHCGIPNIDPAQHKLVIHGMVRQPLEFTLETLSRYPLVTRMAFVECAGNSAPMFSKEPLQATQMLHGLVSNSEWTGVPLSTLLDEAGIDPKAKWLIAEGAGRANLDRSVPRQESLRRCAGRDLPERRAPDARQRLSDASFSAGLRGQHERQVPAPHQGGRSAGMTLLRNQELFADPSGRQNLALPLRHGRKGFITHPSFGMSLKDPGMYAISGVAYSGTGRISKVLVSADGGKSWGEAALQGPIHEKAFTRFVMPWRWEGQPAVLLSRAYDDGGNVQPLRADFVAARGEAVKPVTTPLAFPNQHYNSTTSWAVDSKGEIKHVYA